MSSNFWVREWFNVLGLPAGIPVWFVAATGVICTFCFVILPSGAVMSYLDRKLGASLQARIGPNRTGPGGILQPIADLLKLLQKEALTEWNWREGLWVGVHTMALYSTIAVLPLGSVALLVDTDMSAFLPFWAAFVLSLGTMLLGLNQGSVPGWFGGVRVASQALAGGFPALVCLLTAGISSAGFRWSQIAASQGAWFYSWTAFSNPFQFVAFIVFLISGLVLLGIPPMDAGHSSSDLDGGVAAHLYGRRYSLFRLARFYGIFLWTVISSVLFLGAWNLPQGLVSIIYGSLGSPAVHALELILVLTKSFILMLFLVWIARANPRARIDQVTDFAWKVLSPFALASLIGGALWAGWRAMG